MKEIDEFVQRLSKKHLLMSAKNFSVMYLSSSQNVEENNSFQAEEHCSYLYVDSILLRLHTELNVNYQIIHYIQLLKQLKLRLISFLNWLWSAPPDGCDHFLFTLNLSCSMSSTLKSHLSGPSCSIRHSAWLTIVVITMVSSLFLFGEKL